jgi:hypothetical protein
MFAEKSFAGKIGSRCGPQILGLRQRPLPTTCRGRLCGDLRFAPRVFASAVASSFAEATEDRQAMTDRSLRESAMSNGGEETSFG